MTEDIKNDAGDGHKQECMRRNLRKAIENSGRSQLELAKLIGCEPSTISRWLTHGTLKTRGDSLANLCELLGIYRESLWEDDLRYLPGVSCSEETKPIALKSQQNLKAISAAYMSANPTGLNHLDDNGKTIAYHAGISYFEFRRMIDNGFICHTDASDALAVLFGFLKRGWFHEPSNFEQQLISIPASDLARFFDSGRSEILFYVRERSIEKLDRILRGPRVTDLLKFLDELDA
ncbi:MAG: helix-turn-helix domain-containing protein [Planctomycetia bacterium]